MKLLFCCLVLGTLPALGQRDPSVGPIVLYTQFQQGPPDAVVSSLREELASIMSPLNLRFEWRSLNNARAGETAVELAVVSFRGSCGVAQPAPRNQGSQGALGWTHMSDGAILPFSDIDCDRIRGFLRSELAHLPAARREIALGRAVGRVLAHELYHIFANTQHHGACGVGKAAYSAHELLDPGFRFEAAESDMLRGGKAYTALETNMAGEQ
jgi:hypothetical protein